MTLIASLDVDGVPCLIGDIVLSSSSKPTFEVSLPSRGINANTNGEDPKWFISDVVQKVAVISDRLAIAWSGNEEIAKIVLQEITQLEATSSSLAIDFELYAHNFTEHEDSEELSFVGWIEEDDRLTRFGHCIKQLKSEFLGDPWVAGSGEDEFLAIANSTNMGGTSFVPRTASYSNAANVCNTICDRLIGAEFETDSSLNQYFGGAYEICIWRDKRFQKLEPRVIVLSYIEFLGKQYNSFDRVLIRTDYVSDLLRIYVSIQGDPDAESWVQFVRPLARAREDYQDDELYSLSNPPAELHCNWITNFIRARFNDFPIVSLDAIHTSMAYPGITTPEVTGSLSNFKVTFPDYVVRNVLQQLTEQVARFHLKLPSSNSTSFPLPPELHNVRFVDDEG